MVSFSFNKITIHYSDFNDLMAMAHQNQKSIFIIIKNKRKKKYENPN